MNPETKTTEIEMPEINAPKVPKASKNPRQLKKAFKIGRNEPCPCGSGRKYKHCCLVAARNRRNQQQEMQETVSNLMKQEPKSETGPEL